jgi:hypothetical protein
MLMAFVVVEGQCTPRLLPGPARRIAACSRLPGPAFSFLIKELVFFLEVIKELGELDFLRKEM